MNETIAELLDSLKQNGCEVLSVTVELRHKNFSKKIVALLKVEEA
jgi:hypothetical protein